MSGSSTIPIKRLEPVLGDNPDWGLALYSAPPSHDFCTWLITAELMRRHHKVPGPLRVALGLMDGQLGKVDFGSRGILSGRSQPKDYPPEFAAWMTAGVIRPAIEMIGGVNVPDIHFPVDLEPISRYCEYEYLPRQLVDAARAGFEIPQWQVPDWAFRKVDEFLAGERPVVITLREWWATPDRNSNFDAWGEFYDEIYKRHPVVVLRDTLQANHQFGHRTWPLASTDVRIRAALYQRAYCNLLTANGPFSWCSFSDAPYLLFRMMPKTKAAYPESTAEGWRAFHHLEIGDQWPWAKRGQRMTWRDDTFENIMEEFEAFERGTDLSREERTVRP